MNNDTKYKISVMQAFEDGKEIEELCTLIEGSNWITVSNPAWNWDHFTYRIKSEPKYVPYDSVAEVDRDKWLKHKASKRVCRIMALDASDNTVKLYCGWCDLESIFKDFTYEDGTPCGKLAE